MKKLQMIERIPFRVQGSEYYLKLVTNTIN